MATVGFLSEEEISKIREHLELKHLEVILRPDWGSHTSNYRDQIHNSLKKRMATAYPFSDSSISHCHGMGGFAFAIYDSDHVLQIGFDVEEVSRVSAQVARRICQTEEEYLAAPSPNSLWTAKEAAFKSLKGPNQPKLVSEVEITGWKSLDSQFETAVVKFPGQFSSSLIGGILIQKGLYSFAFFVRRP